jgi:NADH-quinone oxidoreductase subunit J
MVLFLFVIMLLNLSQEEEDIRRGPVVLLGLLIAAGFVGAMAAVRDTSVPGLAARLGGGGAASSPLAARPGGEAVQSAEAFRNAIGSVARPMFETYLVPFEITSILLLAAAVGAVVLAKRNL